jgi:hypothetical protein
LANVKVKKLVASLVQERCEDLPITKGRILRELALMGFANMTDYVAGPQKIR